MISPFARLSFLLGLVLLTSCSTDDGQSIKTQRIIEVPEKTLDLELPAQAVAGRAVLIATGNIQVADRVTLNALSRRGGVSALSGDVTIGSQANVGHVFSGDDLTLRSQSLVDGDAKSGGDIVEQAGAQVTGERTEGASPTLVTTNTMTVTFPRESHGDLEIANDSFRQLAPARYQNAIIRARSVTELEPGTYYFNSLTLEPNAKLRASSTGGPIFIFVDSYLNLGGSAGADISDPEILWGYFGTSTVHITGPTAGRFVAPHATITLGSQRHHRGQFFAKNLVVEPDTTIDYLGFLDSDFVDENQVPIGACDNHTGTTDQVRTICLDEHHLSGARTEFYVNGSPASQEELCVDVDIAPPTVEVRVFQFKEGETLPSSDSWVFLAPETRSKLCPIYQAPIMGGYGDDELEGTPDSDYISGGPGDDHISAGPGFDTLLGGAGRDVIDFLGWRQVIIESSTVVGDADDAYLLDFRPGNLEGLFENVLGGVTEDQVRVVRKDLELTSKQLLPSEDDFARALTGSGQAVAKVRGGPVALANEVLPEVRFEEVWGEIADVATSGHTRDGEGYLLAVVQNITTESGLSCGVKGTCVFSSIVALDAEGNQLYTIPILREEHYITGVASGYTNGEKERAIAVGYTKQMIDGATCELESTGCRDFQPFVMRFDRHTGEVEDFRYPVGNKFDEESGRYTDDFEHGAFYGIARGANWMAYVGETVRNLEVQEIEGEVYYSGDIRGLVWVGPMNGDTDLSAMKILRGFDSNGGYSSLTRLYAAGLQGSAFYAPETVYVGGQVSGRDGWIARLRYDQDIAIEVRQNGRNQFEQPELEVLDERTAFAGTWHGDRVSGVGPQFVAGSTASFNTDGRGFYTSAGLFQRNPFTNPSSTGSHDNGLFFQDDSTVDLYGGSAGAVFADAVRYRSSIPLMVGTITHPWSGDLLTEKAKATSAGRHGFLARPYYSGSQMPEVISSIVHGTPEQPVHVELSSVDEGPDRTLAVGGSTCFPTPEGCFKSPYFVVVNEDLQRENCPAELAVSHCTDNAYNCGEQAVDCGPVCGNVCAVEAPVIPPDTSPVDPVGDGPDDPVDVVDGANLWAESCSACHGDSGEGGRFPCVWETSTSCVESVARPGGLMDNYADLTDEEWTAVANYVVALSVVAEGGERRTCVNPAGRNCK